MVIIYQLKLPQLDFGAKKTKHEPLANFNRFQHLANFQSSFSEPSEPCFGTEIGSVFLIDFWLNSGRGRCPPSTPVCHLLDPAFVYPSG